MEAVLTNEEGNKIIAEFMGYAYYPEGFTEKPYSYHIPCFVKERSPIGLMKRYAVLIDLHYHSDWNWLMPVVEKIESIEDDYHGYFGVHICSNGCTIQATNFRSGKRMAEPPHYFNAITLSTKIESTWFMVVRFIKWYQKQK